MKTYDQHVILKSLDHPPRILFWTIDLFLVMVVPIFVGLAVGSLFVMISGLVLKPFYLRLKKRYPHGRLKHRLYWLLPHHAFVKCGRLQRLPPSHIQELIL